MQDINLSVKIKQNTFPVQLNGYANHNLVAVHLNRVLSFAWALITSQFKCVWLSLPKFIVFNWDNIIEIKKKLKKWGGIMSEGDLDILMHLINEQWQVPKEIEVAYIVGFTKGKIMKTVFGHPWELHMPFWHFPKCSFQ